MGEFSNEPANLAKGNEGFSKETNPNELMREMDRAIRFGSVEDIMALYDRGMDINQTDWQGRTALMMMAVQNNIEAINKMLERGADINFVFWYHDRIPGTALDAANEMGRLEVADFLRKHGAKTAEELGLKDK